MSNKTEATYHGSIIGRLTAKRPIMQELCPCCDAEGYVSPEHQRLIEYAEQQRTEARLWLRWLVVETRIGYGMDEEVDPRQEWGGYDPRQILINRARGVYTRTPVDMYDLTCHRGCYGPSVALSHKHYFRRVLPWPVRRST